MSLSLVPRQAASASPEYKTCTFSSSILELNQKFWKWDRAIDSLTCLVGNSVCCTGVFIANTQEDSSNTNILLN
jgi:hypothetical protein